MEKIIINVSRTGYSTDQCGRTMTVGELIELLSDYDEETEIFFGNDIQSYGWYTYGALRESDIYDEYARKEAFGEDEED